MKIKFAFQGDCVYELELPDNTKVVNFDINTPTSVPYENIEVRLPSISRIEFSEKK